MKFMRFTLATGLGVLLFLVADLRAGENETRAPQPAVATSDGVAAPHFEFSAETSYLLSVAGNPNSYEIPSEFLTARLRWGVNDNDESFFRGYNQVYALALGEGFVRGIENRYFGISLGLRHVFVRPNSRLQFYTSAGVGLGFLDSQDPIFQGQGQDFTFNILSAGGLEYRVNDRFKVEVGIQYQHLSNGGQTNPNPSLNLFGPQVGATFSF
ncbi:MAG: acyloxyacyl hydrolase [Chthoniobacterales bacterium]|nr:acyloxyacyl hydrolase [Chthoniobacterales bacterium]